jgi:hypothetical protein
LVFVAGNTASANVRVGLASDGTTFTASGSGLESYTGSDLKIAMWGAQLEQRSAVSSYTPTTTQPITNYIPALQTAASGVARFDHNPTTGESLGLLVEEQRTNLILQSEDLGTTWNLGSGGTLTINAWVSPAGTLTVDIFTVDYDATIQSKNVTVSNSTTYSLSFYVSKTFTTATFLRLRFGTAAGSVSGFVQMSDMTFGTLSAGITAGTITSVGNNVYKVSVLFTYGASDAGSRSVAIAGTSANNSATPDTGKNIAIWGIQYEQGAFPTSYIATTSASVTRNADAASMTGTNFTSWYRADEGGIMLDYKTSAHTTAFRVATISDGTASNRIEFAISSGSGVGPYLFVVANGTTQVSASSGTYTANTNYKWSAAYEINNYAWSKDGGSVVSDTDALVPIVNQLRIGQDGTGGNLFNGHIRKLAYHPSRLSNAQLQALTAS